MSHSSHFTSKAMGMITHGDRPDEVPKGMAMLVLSDNGWVGTNNGYPFAGQPALYPIAQAQAIKDAWWHHFLLNASPLRHAIEMVTAAADARAGCWRDAIGKDVDLDASICESDNAERELMADMLDAAVDFVTKELLK